MPKFKKIYVEVTNKCNLSCSFCHKTKREKEFISLNNFEKLLYKIKPYTNYIYMHIMGEPLLHPNISELLDICEDYKISANITTNGTLINEKGESIINKPSLRQINFSVHSFEGLNYDDFKKYINNIFYFIDKTKEKGKIISCIRVWNIDETNENDFRRIDIIKEIEKKYGYEADTFKNETKGNGIKLSENVFLQHSRVFSWPDMNKEDIFFEGSCFGLKSHLGILVSGDVVPCCLDCEGDIKLGNIFETDLSEILISERALNIINGFRNKKPCEKLCKTCGWNVK